MRRRKTAMPDAPERTDSRRDFFRQFSGKGALRALGSLVGGSMGLLAELGQEDSPEAAGLALGRGQGTAWPFEMGGDAIPGALESDETKEAEADPASQEEDRQTGDCGPAEGGEGDL
jgi:hypothetical protein